MIKIKNQQITTGVHRKIVFWTVNVGSVVYDTVYDRSKWGCPVLMSTETTKASDVTVFACNKEKIYDLGFFKR